MCLCVSIMGTSGQKSSNQSRGERGPLPRAPPTTPGSLQTLRPNHCRNSELVFSGTSLTLYAGNQVGQGSEQRLSYR